MNIILTQENVKRDFLGFVMAGRKRVFALKTRPSRRAAQRAPKRDARDRRGHDECLGPALRCIVIARRRRA